MDLQLTSKYEALLARLLQHHNHIEWQTPFLQYLIQAVKMKTKWNSLMQMNSIMNMAGWCEMLNTLNC